MRKLRFIRRAEGMKVEQATVHGGVGEVEIGDWSGSVIWGEDEGGWEHVSVSPYNHDITPSWNDMCRLKDIFFEDEEVVLQFHPRKSQYVNIMNNCLHLWRPKEKELLSKLEERAL